MSDYLNYWSYWRKIIVDDNWLNYVETCNKMIQLVFFPAPVRPTAVQPTLFWSTCRIIHRNSYRHQLPIINRFNLVATLRQQRISISRRTNILTSTNKTQTRRRPFLPLQPSSPVRLIQIRTKLEFWSKSPTTTKTRIAATNNNNNNNPV